MGPQVNIVGSFFPAWMLCGVIGIVATLCARLVLVRVGLDPYVSPRALVYPSLAILITLVLWLGLFRG